MKFSITTKSGRSITKDFNNYNDAAKYAKEKFGLGCIVQQISINSVVRNALAMNAGYEIEATSYLHKRSVLIKRVLECLRSAVEEDEGNARIHIAFLKQQTQKDPKNKILVDSCKAIVDGSELFAGAVRSIEKTLTRL